MVIIMGVRQVSAPFLMAVVITFPVFLYGEGDSPGRIVKDTVDQILEVLDSPDLDENQKRQSVYHLARRHIDFDNMARRILAAEWQHATDDQKIAFISLFEKILMNDYWTRIRNYSGERIEYLAVSIAGDIYATVDTVIVRDGDHPEIPISYRMEFRDGRWLAHDFLVESLSLVQKYQRDYLAIIKNRGIEGLLEHLRRQVTPS